jgi:GAF domain-containing protein
MSTINSPAFQSFEVASFSYAEWRQRFLTIILRSACVIGLLVTITASLDAPAFLAAFYIGSYLAILVLTVGPFSYRTRAIGFLSVLYVLAISNLLETGVRIDARLFLMTMTLMAGMLFGTRAGIATIVIGIVTIAVAGFFILTGRYTIITRNPVGDLEIWIISALVLLMLESLSLLGLTLLQRGFDTAQQQSQRLLNMILAERASLERRVEERTAQLQASAEVGRAAASILDQHQLLAEIVQLITRRFNYYYAAVFTLDPTGKWLVLREGTGEAGRIMKERGHRLALGGQSMVGLAAQARQPRVAQRVDASTERFDNPLLPETQSEIALPLITGNQLLGVLNVQTTQPNAFDESIAVVLQTMANQIATALSNTQQFEQTETALKQTERLYQTSAAISEAPDAASVLQVVVDAALTDADRALLLLFDGKGTPGRWASAKVGGSWTRHPEDRPIPIGLELPVEHVPFINAATPVKPFIVQDVNDSRVEEGYRQALQRLNAQALVALALHAGGAMAGMLVLAYREARILAEQDIQPFRTLGTQMAGTLYNQRLVAETRAAAQQLDEVNRRLTGKAWQEFARSSRGLRHIDAAPGFALTPGTGPLPAQLSAPVILRHAVIGALRVEDARPDREWTPDEQALLQAVANDLSLAIENQRLIEETEKRAQRERLVAEISSKMFSQNDLESIVEIAATELGRVLQVGRAEVRIGADALVAADAAAASASGNGRSQETES